MTKSKDYCIILDRKRAIEKAVKMAGKDDIILIAGKGHEDYQIIGNKRYDFDDRKIAKMLINKNLKYNKKDLVNEFKGVGSSST